MGPFEGLRPATPFFRGAFFVWLAAGTLLVGAALGCFYQSELSQGPQRRARTSVWSPSTQAWTAGPAERAETFDFRATLPPDALSEVPRGQLAEDQERRGLGLPADACAGISIEALGHLGARWLARTRCSGTTETDRLFVVNVGSEQQVPEWKEIPRVPELGRVGQVAFSSPAVAWVFGHQQAVRLDLGALAWRPIAMPPVPIGEDGERFLVGVSLDIVLYGEVDYFDNDAREHQNVLESFDLRTGEWHRRAMPLGCGNYVLAAVPPSRAMRLCVDGSAELVDALTLASTRTTSPKGRVIRAAWTTDGRVFVESDAAAVAPMTYGLWGALLALIGTIGYAAATRRSAMLKGLAVAVALGLLFVLLFVVVVLSLYVRGGKHIGG